MDARRHAFADNVGGEGIRTCSSEDTTRVIVCEGSPDRGKESAVGRTCKWIDFKTRMT